MNCKPHWLLAALFCVAQMAVLAIFGYTPYPDSQGYIGLAGDSLLYGEPYPVAEKLGELTFVWNVGAINAVALSLWLAGSVWPLLVVYTLMKGATAWLLYDTGRQLFGPKVAIVALVLYVLYPANYGEATSAHSEVPHTFFMMLGICLALRQRFLAAGVVLALANWFRPMAIVPLVVMALWLLCGRRWRGVGGLLAGYALVLCLIGTASYVRTGHVIVQAKTGWMALLQYSVDHSPQDDAHLTYTPPEYDCFQRDSLWREHALRWIADNPVEYVLQMPGKLLGMYGSDNVNFCVFLPQKASMEYMYEPLSMRTLAKDAPRLTALQWLVVCNLLYYAVLLALSFVCLCVVAWRRRWRSLALWIPGGIVLLETLMLLFVGHGEARFHQPLMPFFVLLAALAVVRFKGLAREAAPIPRSRCRPR